MTPVRVAILGTAHPHLADHREAIRRDPRAVAAPGLDHADAVIIDSVTADHPRLLRAAIEAGKPTLVEKPLAATVPETAELTALIDAAAVPVTTAMFLRCAPALRGLRTFLSEEPGGPVTSVRARFSHPGLLDGWFRGPTAWMLDPRQGGIGGFADLGIHLLDLLLWLRPGASLRAVSAVKEHAPGIAMDVGGTARLEWDGVPVTLHCGWRSRPGGFDVRVDCARGSCTVSGGRLMIVTGTGHRAENHPPPDAAAVVPAWLDRLHGVASWEPPTSGDIARCARLLQEIDDAAG
ncbi:Gfo/Idh/MocA family protein [Amycolatopsis azurea]|uniref:Oxidoreductase n=1 Tax=Amycolatopsis azurea DSM 43854 TaxID=1238180 RepID=M2NZY1_9PSEU|nr:Gfo/Idh/MocA family oxidoreductase [Amycolatopsis azurea]EMD28274.1 oxidoreductase [Amycolatopsis azurea DSM 43854]